MATDETKKAETKPDEGVDPRLSQFAEQLGTLLGTARAKADEWLDREKLSTELGRIRDGAADLLAQVNRAADAAQKSAAPPAARSAARMGEVKGKKVGKKNVKNAMKGRG